MRGDCNACEIKCPKAEMAHNAAVGRMHATNEVIRLLKEREQGCDFCCYTELPEKKLYPKENDGFDFYAGAWKQIAEDDFIEDETDRINFCPMCGRKIGGDPS